MNQTTENQAVGQDPAVEFGRILRLGREEKGLSIGEVAERLKLSAKQIEAFESGNYEGMPEGVFIRGFLRSYGRFLDFDEQAVSMYLDRIVPQSGKNSYNVETNTSGSLNYQNQKIEKSFPTWIFGVIAIAIIIAGVYIWQGKSKEENAKQTSRSEESVSLGEVAAPNLDNGNVSVVPMPAGASAASQALSQGNEGSANATGNELVVKVRYRSMLVIKDKTGKELLNSIVPANSEHRFSGQGPYDVWIGYAKGAVASYGSQDIQVSDHMIDKKTASFTAGK